MNYLRYTLFLFLFCLCNCDIAKAESQNDSCRDSAKVCREKAIALARQKGYYPDGNPEITPQVQFDPCYRRWIITGISYHHSNKGDCKNTNGCTVEERSLIIIHADTGKILFKEKKSKVYPNYE